MKYLFVDGGYLRSVYAERILTFSGKQFQADLEAIKSQFGASKVFYYDCIDDQKKNGESELEFQNRLESQKNYFEYIESIDGVHARLGSLAGTGKRRRQKEVDVMLAVEMLSHSYSKNIYDAVLLAGDRDFRPLIQALVTAGVYVRVVFYSTSGSKELAKAADARTLISMKMLCDWALLEPGEERNSFLPYHVNNHILNDNTVLDMVERQGLIGNRRPIVWRLMHSHYTITLAKDGHLVSPSGWKKGDNPMPCDYLCHTDFGILEKYCNYEFGPIQWDDL